MNSNPVVGKINYMAVPLVRHLVTSLSPRRPEFAPGSVHMGFVVDKVTLGQIFLRILRFTPVSVIPSVFSILIIWGMKNRSIGDRSSNILSVPIYMNKNKVYYNS
jgi:hypothetical protein